MNAKPLNYDELFNMDPYALDAREKETLLSAWLPELVSFHEERCAPYRSLCSVIGPQPAVPVRLFKEYDLMSSGTEDMVKTMTSSGTTSQIKSKIHLDKETSMRQTKALMRIVSSFTKESKRLPMLVADAPGTVKDRNMFSARTAGIRGFSMMGRDITFALHDDMSLNVEALKEFASKYKGQKVLVFGFTFMIWKYLVEEMMKEDLHLDLSGILVHGGGWKKLADQAVSASEFKQGCRAVLGNVSVHDYYGMVEQTGSIAMECECGHLHVSVYSDVKVVDPLTMEEAPRGQRGLIESISLLPTSYPGNILLTEDEGAVLGVDDCPCGRLGKYFVVYGRQKGAELRGCSDTYAA